MSHSILASGGMEGIYNVYLKDDRLFKTDDVWMNILIALLLTVETKRAFTKPERIRAEEMESGP